MLSAAGFIGFGLMYAVFPGIRDTLVAEDEVVENLSALLFLLGAGLGVLRLWGSRTRSLAYWGIPLLALVGFLDEMSFGERMFGLSMPVVLGVKIDAVHDLFYVFYNIVGGQVGRRGFILLGVVLATLVAAVGWRRRATLTSALRRHSPLLFVLIATVMVFAALVIDLDFVRHRFLILIEELLELNAGLALVFAALAIPSRAGQRQLAGGGEPSVS